MFEIDLLKGEGLPNKERARNMIVVAAASAIPAIAAIAMVGIYLNNKVMISIGNREIAGWKAKTDDLAGAVATQRAAEREKALCAARLAELTTAVNRHTQWSPILATVVRDMPESVVLTALELRERSVTIRVPRKDDPQKTTDKSVPVPVLRMNVSATPQSDGDNDVKTFRQKILASASLGPKLENITVSQEADMLSGLNVVSYEIDCLFKPKL